MKWISVEDRLPETDDCVDVLCFPPLMIATFFPEDEEEEFRFYLSLGHEFRKITGITHWAKPEPPKQQ